MIARITIVSVLALLAQACSDASAQDPIEITADLLPCASDPPAVGEPWESAPWPPGSTGACEWFAFDGRRSYRVTHPLGRIPRTIIVYLSFDSDGRSSTIAPGDPTRIVSADENVVEIRNGTDQDFFAKVVLE